MGCCRYRCRVSCFNVAGVFNVLPPPSLIYICSPSWLLVRSPPLSLCRAAIPFSRGKMLVDACVALQLSRCNTWRVHTFARYIGVWLVRLVFRRATGQFRMGLQYNQQPCSLGWTGLIRNSFPGETCCCGSRAYSVTVSVHATARLLACSVS
jgi:hypothetical protein